MGFMGRPRNQAISIISGSQSFPCTPSKKSETIFACDKIAQMCRTCLQFINIYEAMHYEYVPQGEPEHQLTPYGM